MRTVGQALEVVGAVGPVMLVLGLIGRSATL
jgi:hypothetical protein